jgi:AraC-like DNA-binding protein
MLIPRSTTELGACSEARGNVVGSGASAPEHLVALAQEPLNKGETDEFGSAGHEGADENSSFARPGDQDRIRGRVIIMTNDGGSTIYAVESVVSSHSSGWPVDPLSDVLSLLKPRTYMCGGLDLGGDWCIQFGQHEGIKCYAVVSGQSWLSVDGIPDPVLLERGDCFLLPGGRPFRLASDLSLTPVDACTAFQLPLNGAVGLYHGGGDCLSVGGHFTLTGRHASILLGVLPPIVHLRRESDRAALRWCLERMMQELRAPEPGGFLVAQQLAYMMLVQALRLHLAEGLGGGVGWLFALADQQMSAAIHAMHDAPAHRWTLQELGRRAGMCRSTFALKFKQAVGASPMEYLTRWRMLRAGDRLVNSSESIAVIALSLGYESESAFSTAFKRVMGCSPRQYGRGRNRPHRSPAEVQAARTNRLDSMVGP